MSKSNKNCYKRGYYKDLFDFLLSFKGKGFTRPEVMTFAMEKLAMQESAAKASVGVVMSPREDVEGRRGDCRGNFSAMGHLYYLSPFKRKMVKDADGNETKEEQRYQLKWRKEPLRPFRREDQGLTEEEINARDSRKAKAKADRKADKLVLAKANAQRKIERQEKRKKRLADATAKKAQRKIERQAKREKRLADAVTAKADRAKAKAVKTVKAKAKPVKAKAVKTVKAKAKPVKAKAKPVKAEAKAKAKALAAEKTAEAEIVKSVPSETAEGQGMSEAEAANATVVEGATTEA